MTNALGLDIGGTNARAGLVDTKTGRLVEAAKISLGDRSPDAVIEAVAGLVENVAGKNASGSLGVGFAGMLDGSVVVNAPNLGWQNVDFGTLLAKRLGRPVTLINDLTAAAWGEFSAGSAKGSRDTLTVFAGTGVGSAIISNARLLNGSNGVAGEFGHIKVVLEGGRPCGCGQFGCLEAYAGGARLEKWMNEVGLSGNVADLEKMAQTSGASNAKARELYDFATDSLGLAIANQVTVLNPSMVVLGGGVLSNCPGMVERITTIVQQRANAPAAKTVRMVMAKLGDDAGLVGAALLGGDGGA